MRRQDFNALSRLTIDTVNVYGENAFQHIGSLNAEHITKVDQFINSVILHFSPSDWKIHDFNVHTHDGMDHPNGVAVDLSFSGGQCKLGKLALHAVILGWKLVGFYPEWNRPGLHLSSRPVKTPAMWYAYYDIVDGTAYGNNGKKIQKYVYYSQDPKGVGDKLILLGG